MANRHLPSSQGSTSGIIGGVEPPHSTAGCNAAGLVLGEVLPMLGGSAVATDALAATGLKELVSSVADRAAAPLVRCGCAVGLGQAVGSVSKDGDCNTDPATVAAMVDALGVLWKVVTAADVDGTPAASADPVLAAAVGLVYAAPAFVVCASLKHTFAGWWAAALTQAAATSTSAATHLPSHSVVAAMRIVAAGWSAAAVSEGIAGSHIPVELFNALRAVFDSDASSEPSVLALAYAASATAHVLTAKPAADLRDLLGRQLAQIDGTAPSRFAAVIGLVALVEAPAIVQASAPFMFPNTQGSGDDDSGGGGDGGGVGSGDESYGRAAAAAAACSSKDVKQRRPVRVEQIIVSTIKSDRAAGVSAAAAVLCGKQIAAADSADIMLAHGGELGGSGGGISSNLSPPDLDYLPAELYACTRALFSAAVGAGAVAGSGSLSAVALTCLLELQGSLPPVNWTSTMQAMLAPGGVTATVAVRFAVARYESSPSLRNAVESFLEPGTFATLPVSAQSAVCTELPDLLASLPPAKVSAFLSDAILFACKAQHPQHEHPQHNGDVEGSSGSGGGSVGSCVQVEVFEAALKGILPALISAEDGGALAGWAAALHALVAELYALLLPTAAWLRSADGQTSALLTLLAQCFSHLPHTTSQEVLNIDCATATPTAALRATLLRGRLVGMANFPLSWLIPCYTWLLQGDAAAVAGSESAANEAGRLVVAEVLGSTFSANGDSVGGGGGGAGGGGSAITGLDCKQKRKQQQQRMLLDLLDRMLAALRQQHPGKGVGGAEDGSSLDVHAVHFAVLSRGLRVMATLVLPEGEASVLVPSSSGGGEALLGYSICAFLVGRKSSYQQWNNLLQRLVALRRLPCCRGMPRQWLSAALCEMRHTMRRDFL